METKVVELDLNDVLPNRFQPRIKFSEASIQELANSIKGHGVIQPIVVRKIGDKYEIIAGERRYKASVLAGKTTIPAIITDLSEKDSAEVALIENVQRKDLTPIEEAISYKKILDMGYLTQDILASKLGKTQSTIANKLRLLNLDDDVQEALLNEQISERHARSLLRLTSQDKQRELLTKIINERLTVRKTDEEIDKMLNNDNNVEVLNFNQPIEQKNEVEKLNVEPLEVFSPNIETLNIPMQPIVGNEIPEVLPTEEKSAIFNPTPEVIVPKVPPVPTSVFEEPLEELNLTSSADSNLDLPKMDIPMQPIVENPQELQDRNINNPGFMDINKIEKEATDIFIEKPLAPVENLLEPSQDIIPPVLPVETEEESEGAEDILVPGKFFNLFPEEEEVKKEEASSFDFNLDVSSLNNVEAVNNLPSLENLENPQQSLTIENKEENNVVVESTQNQNIEPQPVLNPLNNYNPIHENPIPVEPDPNLYSDTIAELEFPTLNEKEEMPEINHNQPPVVNYVNTGSNLKNAINMVRDLDAQLSRMGYIVDTEEFDFEDMYQIIFKINK